MIQSFSEDELLDDFDDCEVFEAEETLETSEPLLVKEEKRHHTYQIVLRYYSQKPKEKRKKKKNHSTR